MAAALLSTTAWAEKKTVDVDVKVDGTEGQVMIIKDVDGNVSKITETIDLSGGGDVQARIDDLLKVHGIDIEANGADVQKEVIILNGDDMPHDGQHKMMWVQKSNDVNVDVEDGVAKVVIKKDHNGEVEVIEETIEIGDGMSLDQIIDDLMAEHGIDAGDGEVHKKIIKLDKRVAHIDHNKPRLGFMASVTDMGWDVISVVDGSGAAEAGLKAGDLIIAVDGEVTGKDGLGLDQFIKQDLKVDEVSVLTVMRGGNELNIEAAAKVVDSPDVLMKNVHRWVDKDGNITMENVHGGKTFEFKFGDKEGIHLGDKDVHVVTTSHADAYFFSSGKMNQWLGKNHHFSTVTEQLGTYFGVKQGVLVLEVDADNKLGLKDGDVIQSINGEAVHSPKDVVKKLSALKNDDQVEIEIFRNKEKLYLES